jgi:hypothetical protein
MKSVRAMTTATAIPVSLFSFAHAAQGLDQCLIDAARHTRNTQCDVQAVDDERAFALRVIRDSMEPRVMTQEEAGFYRDLLAAEFVPLPPEQTKILPIRKHSPTT